MKAKKSKKTITTAEAVPVILHGEAMLFQVSEIPSSAKKIKSSHQNYHIIADSETTGNHHVVDCDETMEFFMDENGSMFMRNEKPTQVRCVQSNRHTEIPLSPGLWSFSIQEEYDHFAQHLRQVRD